MRTVAGRGHAERTARNDDNKQAYPVSTGACKGSDPLDSSKGALTHFFKTVSAPLSSSRGGGVPPNLRYILQNFPFPDYSSLLLNQGFFRLCRRANIMPG